MRDLEVSLDFISCCITIQHIVSRRSPFFSQVLSLGANRLSGPLPGHSLQRLESLKELHLYRNQLRGPIPHEIGALRTLTSVWLFENLLSGELPDIFGQLTNLVDFRVNSNRLRGHIPPSLQYCSSLKVCPLWISRT